MVVCKPILVISLRPRPKSRLINSAVTVATILRWLKTVISQSGQQGSGGTVRSVTTSTAIGIGVTMEKVLEAGDWSRASTFRNFYYKSVPINHLQKMMSSL